MIVLTGITSVNTNSTGGGFGISAGAGRGHGGVGINYQGLDFSTTGTHTNASVAVYAAPSPPDGLERKKHWLDECLNSINKATAAVEKIDSFAKDEAALSKGLFSKENISYEESRHKKASKLLQSFQEYEAHKALWDKMRVCLRCGESFVTSDDRDAATANFEIPAFNFPGANRRCQNCQSYHWKTPEAYFHIMISNAEDRLRQDWTRLREAIDYKQNPNDGGFWKRLGNKLLVLSEEQAQENVRKSEAYLEQAIKERDEAMLKYEFNGTRVCLDCKSFYAVDARC